MIRRSVELRDDQATVNLEFRIGRRTVRLAFQSTRTDSAGGGGGFFTRGRGTPPHHSFAHDPWSDGFDIDEVDVDDDGYAELPDGRRMHVDDPRFLSLFR